MAGTNDQGSNADSLLACQLAELLLNMPPLPTECCIYRVPVNLRSLNESTYTPRIVSIGPLHHGAEKLQPMEVQKYRYLQLLLDRNPAASLEALVQVMRSLEQSARSYYESQFTCNFTSDEFVKMMLLDGCFIVVFFVYIHEIDGSDEWEDRLFKGMPLYRNIYIDLSLLENQVPFFILERIYHFVHHLSRSGSFLDVTVAHLHGRKENPFSSFNHPVKHFVDLTLKLNYPSDAGQRRSSQGKYFINLPSATELYKSGIQFRKGVSNCFLDIKFTNAVLQIPPLTVEDFTEQYFRNLIALEQCHGYSTSYIIDYMILMDFLINTPDDVSLLRSRGIINNCLGSDEDASKLFNDIVKGVHRNIGDLYYYGILEEVTVHYSNRRNLWKANLKRDYFQNPWTIISLNAALVLLFCTIIQTVCSIFSMAR